MTGSYESALAAMRLGSGEALRLARRATEEAPRSADALALEASLLVCSRDPRDAEAAGWAFARLRRLPLGLRHHEHAQAIAAALDGDFERAGLHYDRLLLKEPQDTLALWAAQTVDYYLGAAPALAARAERVAQHVSPSLPGYHFVLASLAFGLQECGDYAAAEDHARRALELEPADLRARHALMHVFEMQGRAAEGLALAAGSNHLVWHHALFQLQLGRARKALELYDGAMRQESLADLIDAAALLWRLRLDGISDGGRFAGLADAWVTRTDGRPWYVFNDLHAVMALVGAGRIGDAEAVVERLSGYVHCGGSGTNVAMTAEIGLPASRAIIRFAQERYADVIDELLPIRRVLQRFGGSHAQRDVLQRTLLEAALQSRQLDLARALLSERLAVRETSVYGWTRQARLFEALGRPVDAAAAAEVAAASRVLARAS